MSEKRPETSRDIVSRSQAVKGAHLTKRRRGYSVDLQQHMAECDANYHRLTRMLPGLTKPEVNEFSLALPDLSATVVFNVLERGPYTTLLNINFAGDDLWLGMVTPQMEVRVYHDAHSAEVVSYQNENYFHGKYEYPNTRMRQRDEKVQVNRFLSEFLSHCMEHGVSAQPVSF